MITEQYLVQLSMQSVPFIPGNGGDCNFQENETFDNLFLAPNLGPFAAEIFLH